MKNKLVKGAHLSESQCTEIIKLFCEDLTATQISKATGVSRITINNYLKQLRGYFMQPDVDPSVFANDAKASGFYSIEQSNNHLTVLPLEVEDKKAAQNWLDQYDSYASVLDLAHYRIIKKNANQVEQAIVQKKEEFVSWLKYRLTKFRGINKQTMHLHVQESLFRFNFKNENLFEIITNAIAARPLQFKKQ
jgi:transposase